MNKSHHKKPEPRKPKTREYYENLLLDAGLGDKQIIKIVKKCLLSDSPPLITKGLELLVGMSGAKDVDKKTGEDIIPLQIGNIDLADLDRLSNRCAYCQHKEFKPIDEGIPHKELEPVKPEILEESPVIEELTDEI